MRIEPGIYLVHKRVGETSYAHVRAFMDAVRLQGVRKDKLPICHGGALDPFAEGLLLALAGRATRLMDLLHPIPKTYVAEVAWGSETGSGDGLGAVVARGDASLLTEALLDEVLPRFLGFTDQVPPLHSNKRIGGERAYALAHRGEDAVLPPSRVYLHEARWLAHELPRRSTLHLVARGGYYVRALARDLGQMTKARAHLSALRRTAIGPWQDPGPGAPAQAAPVRGAALLPWCPSRALGDKELARVQGGAPIPLGEVRAPALPLPAGFPDPDAPVLGLHAGLLVALLRPDGESLRLATRLFPGL